MVDYQEEGGENGYACTNALAPVYERNILWGESLQSEGETQADDRAACKVLTNYLRLGH